MLDSHEAQTTLQKFLSNARPEPIDWERTVEGLL
jgi:hypothetical protein